jgi:ABC-type glutathione transport system ATPase component
LDAYNAYNVIECLVTLARDFNRTVVFTIHQPRSNIAALFDQLILLAEGKMVYSGPFSKCQDYFDHIGHPCPPGFNIADYLVDLTMHASRNETETPTPTTSSESDASDVEAVAGPADGLVRPTRGRKDSIRKWQEHQLYDPRPRSSGSQAPSLNDEFRTTQQWASITEQTNAGPIDSAPQNGRHKRSRKRRQPGSDGEDARLHAAEHLATLVYSYDNSAISDQIREEIYDAVNGNDEIDIPPEEASKSKRIGWLGQFVILSKRTFKNLYRNPMLMLTHYSIAVLMARAFSE